MGTAIIKTVTWRNHISKSSGSAIYIYGPGANIYLDQCFLSITDGDLLEETGGAVITIANDSELLD